jgi:hypothetical protein
MEKEGEESGEGMKKEAMKGNFLQIEDGQEKQQQQQLQQQQQGNKI